MKLFFTFWGENARFQKTHEILVEEKQHRVALQHWCEALCWNCHFSELVGVNPQLADRLLCLSSPNVTVTVT